MDCYCIATVFEECRNTIYWYCKQHGRSDTIMRDEVSKDEVNAIIFYMLDIEYIRFYYNQYIYKIYR